MAGVAERLDRELNRNEQRVELQLAAVPLLFAAIH